MEITEKEYAKIEKYLPKQRGNVQIQNLQLIKTLLYDAENGCKWRALPERFGKWHTVYERMNRWNKNGVLQRVFEGLQLEGIIQIRLENLCLDSTIVKVHQDVAGALKQAESNPSGAPEAGSPPKFIWLPHLTGL